MCKEESERLNPDNFCTIPTDAHTSRGQQLGTERFALVFWYG